jgi:hypothetical protein
VDNLKEGKWVYTIEHWDYFTLTDSVIFPGDTNLIIHLTKKLATVQFEIRDTSGPIDNIPVVFDNWEVQTDNNGIAWFFNLPARQKYGYIIESEGYRAVTDSLYLESDTVVSLKLQFATGVYTTEYQVTELYPNPAAGTLNIGMEQAEACVLLINPEGKVLMEEKLYRGLNTINVSEIPPGIYFFRIQTNENTLYGKVMIIR